MYNFVIFGITNEFYRHSFADLKKLKNVVIREDIYENKNKLLYYLYRVHTFPKTKLRWPFTSVWDKRSFHQQFANDDKTCFVFMPKHANRKTYFEYLRKEYPGCKLVMMFRDRVDRNLSWFPYLRIDDIKKDFDLVYSYNKYDCEKYGLIYFNTEASKEDLVAKSKDTWSDVVFIGNVKDRLDKILSAYKKFKNVGLKTDFYIVGAPKEKRLSENGIVFADKGVSYTEMLDRTVNSRCVLEVSQPGEYGFTSRAQEAFMYNKKLITDSLIVKDQRFYPSEHILFYKSVDDIDPEFVKNLSMPDYKYNDDYSPIRVIEQIEVDLNNHFK